MVNICPHAARRRRSPMAVAARARGRVGPEVLEAFRAEAARGERAGVSPDRRALVTRRRLACGELGGALVFGMGGMGRVGGGV